VCVPPPYYSNAPSSRASTLNLINDIQGFLRLIPFLMVVNVYYCLPLGRHFEVLVPFPMMKKRLFIPLI
jgi:hypothetical protein